MVGGQGSAALDRRLVSRLTLSSMSVETRKVDEDEAGMRLDRWFRAHFPALPFGHLQKLLRTGQVRVDGARVKTNTRLAPGQRVRVPPLKPANSVPPHPNPLPDRTRVHPSSAPLTGRGRINPTSTGERVGVRGGSDADF